MDCPFYKVASFEMNDLPLIKRIVSTNKPLIISTGMASLKEISDVYLKAKEYGAKKYPCYIVSATTRQKFLISILIISKL